MTEDQQASDALKRCHSGDVEALAVLFGIFGDRVYRLCFNVLGSQSDAEDAAQEVFLRVFAKAGSFAGRSQVSTWIHRLTVNFCLNQLKSRKRKATTSLEAIPQAGPITSVDGSGQMEQQETVVIVRSVLARMPEEARAIFLLREVEDCSYREISEILDLPQGTVMSRLSRARDKFRQLAAGSATDLGVISE
ncbi:MAG: RNA polymerase sigma factor [Planctomycetota bacterium]